MPATYILRNLFVVSALTSWLVLNQFWQRNMTVIYELLWRNE